MFNKFEYTARKWQFMSNNYDIWRFNSRTRTAAVHAECGPIPNVLHILCF